MLCWFWGSDDINVLWVAVMYLEFKEETQVLVTSKRYMSFSKACIQSLNTYFLGNFDKKLSMLLTHTKVLYVKNDMVCNLLKKFLSTNLWLNLKVDSYINTDGFLGGFVFIFTCLDSNT